MHTLTISTHPETGDSVYISNKGDAFYSVNLLAALMDIDSYTLTQASWFGAVENYASTYSNTLTADGLQRVTYLIKAEDAYELINYYIDEVAQSDCSQVTQLRQEMGCVGAKMFAYLIGDYNVNATPQVTGEPTQHERLNTFNETMRLLEMTGCNLSNPRYSQLYQDVAHNILGSAPPSTTEDY